MSVHSYDFSFPIFIDSLYLFAWVNSTPPPFPINTIIPNVARVHGTKLEKLPAESSNT